MSTSQNCVSTFYATDQNFLQYRLGNIKNKWRMLVPSQPTIACSKVTIRKLEQGVKYVQSWQ